MVLICVNEMRARLLMPQNNERLTNGKPACPAPRGVRLLYKRNYPTKFFAQEMKPE